MEYASVNCFEWNFKLKIRFQVLLMPRHIYLYPHRHYKRYIRTDLRPSRGDDNIKTMYLPRSSKWSMTRRRKRPNLFGWTLLGLVLLFGYYFNQVYLPAQPNPFDATPTVTRSPESFVTEAEA